MSGISNQPSVPIYLTYYKDAVLRASSPSSLYNFYTANGTGTDYTTKVDVDRHDTPEKSWVLILLSGTYWMCPPFPPTVQEERNGV